MAVAFEEAVLAEDLAVQEAYDERSLPLEPTAEVHTRADRSTIEPRRLLADLIAAARQEPPGSRGAGGGAGVRG